MNQWVLSLRRRTGAHGSDALKFCNQQKKKGIEALLEHIVEEEEYRLEVN